MYVALYFYFRTFQSEFLLYSTNISTNSYYLLCRLTFYLRHRNKLFDIPVYNSTFTFCFLLLIKGECSNLFREIYYYYKNNQILLTLTTALCLTSYNTCKPFTLSNTVISHLFQLWKHSLVQLRAVWDCAFLTDTNKYTD